MAITLRVRGEHRYGLDYFFLRSSLDETPPDDPSTFSAVYLDGVSVEFTQTRYWLLDQYYYIDVVIPSYTEDEEQHEIKLVRYARDDASGEEIEQNHYFYTQLNERNLLTMIGNHLFRDEVFEKPVDIYLGLLTSVDSETEVLRYCSGDTLGTTEGEPTLYERKAIHPSAFTLVSSLESSANFGNAEYIKNGSDIVYSSFIESCVIVGAGIYLSPFDALPVYTMTFAYPISYLARSPTPDTEPEIADWMTSDVVIREDRFQFRLDSSYISRQMKELIYQHIFRPAWTISSSPSDYLLTDKPTEFFIGLITEVTLDSDGNYKYFTEPTRTSSGYDRVSYDCGDDQWELIGESTYQNSNTITFPAPTATWGTIVGIGVYRVSEVVVNSTEEILFYKPLDTPVIINSGESPYVIAANALSLEIS